MNSFTFQSKIPDYQIASASFYQALNLKTGELLQLDRRIKENRGRRNCYFGTLVWLEKNNLNEIKKKYKFRVEVLY